MSKYKYMYIIMATTEHGDDYRTNPHSVHISEDSAKHSAEQLRKINSGKAMYDVEQAFTSSLLVDQLKYGEC